ncbi:styrene monooxygenase/indole monooxygenase family protein [Kitasatospora sp. NPDC093806]|uniref:styrene monooxygenase/indole monooxygenase family protein n=1 Tax=Kitasatospora sp. NPDC093806 TaxID=3155075 RepID=UPI0034206494
MRRILIVGAGQSGLQLALGLQSHGYDVTVVTNRTAERIRGGRVLSSQCMFDTALGHERALGLDFWVDETPRIEAVGLSVAGPEGTRLIDFVGRLDGYAQSVDQRVKMAGWLETFERRGGRVEVREADAAALDALAPGYDLVLIAAGKGDLTSLFERDAARSPYDRPQRVLAVAYVHGLGPRADYDRSAVHCNVVPGVGEFFVMPCLTTSGPCDILLWEGVPGGPVDVFGGPTGGPTGGPGSSAGSAPGGIGPAEHLRLTLDLMKTFIPWEYDRTRGGVELTDAGATLAGRLTPTVRRPIAELPGGTPVLGVADVVVANDPLTGQGANNAAKCAAGYLAAILAHGDKPFDRDFMQAAFDDYWTATRASTDWSNTMVAPPQEHILTLLGAAGGNPAIADRFANGFDNPADLDDWFLDADKAAAYLASFAEPSAK